MTKQLGYVTVEGMTVIKSRKRKTQKIRKILVLAKLCESSGRNILSGIIRYASKVRSWRIVLLQEPDDMTVKAFRAAQRDGTDGIIMTLTAPAETMAGIASSETPAAFVNIFDKTLAGRGNAAFVWTDNEKIGECAARHFLGCGNFASYGYVHARPEDAEWSLGRAKGFARILAAKGRKPMEFAPRGDIGSSADCAALAKWLKSIPRPAAVLVAYDWRATHVMDACYAAGLEIPHDVAIMGVDDDELCCPVAVPQLSSIRPDYDEIGMKAAAALDSIMSGQAKKLRRDLRVATKRVVSRESTSFISPSVALVENAMSFIRAYANDRITPEDVVRHLGVSRRLAELRFGECRGETIRKALENERLNTAKHLLETTGRAVARITTQAGFKSPAHFSRLFRKRFGKSPSEWRGESA